MSLIAGLVLVPSPVSGKEEESGLRHLPNNEKATFYLLIPPTYKKSRTYPLLVSLHGAGEKGDRMVRYWKRAAADRGFVLCCPNSVGFSWAQADVNRILTIMEYVLRTYSVDRKRILLNGISAGGMVTYYLGFMVPNLFPCINPMSAALNDSFLPLLKKAKPMPVFITHGAKDTTIPPSAGRKAAEILRKRGFDVTYLERPEDGHEVPEGVQERILLWAEGKWKKGKTSPRER